MNTLISFRQRIFSRRTVLPASQMADRLTWLWLATGAALLAFTSWQTVIPLAGWPAPIFMLRFARTQRLIVALSVLPLASCVAAFVAWRNDFFGPPTTDTNKETTSCVPSFRLVS